VRFSYYEKVVRNLSHQNDTQQRSTRGPASPPRGEQLILINASALYEHKNAREG
jgi:hypothetical protein